MKHVKPTLTDIPEGESWWLPDVAIVRAMLAFRNAALIDAAGLASAKYGDQCWLAEAIIALKDGPSEKS